MTLTTRTPRTPHPALLTTRSLRGTGVLLAGALVLGGCSAAPSTGDGADTPSPSASTPDATPTDGTDGTDAPVTVYLTRHGKTMLNSVERAQGWSDSPLTPPGVEVAEHLALGLDGVDFVGAYSSSLVRQRQTAEIVLDGMGEDLDITVLDGLREYSFGHFEGADNKELWDAIAQANGYADQPTLMEAVVAGSPIVEFLDVMPELDAESVEHGLGMAEDTPTVAARMADAMATVVAETRAKGGGDVLVVSSGLSIVALLETLTDDPVVNSAIGNASVTKLVYHGDSVTLESFNDLSYVEKGAQVAAGS